MNANLHEYNVLKLFDQDGKWNGIFTRTTSCLRVRQLLVIEYGAIIRVSKMKLGVCNHSVFTISTTTSLSRLDRKFGSCSFFDHS